MYVGRGWLEKIENGEESKVQWKKLTYRPLLQPSQGLERLARGRVVEDQDVAVVAHGPRGAPHLDADDDQADEPQHEEHEGAEDHDGREQPPLRYEPQQQHDEDDRERRDRDPVGEEPVPIWARR